MSAPDHTVLQQAVRWLDQGKKVALATVIETWGSAPQPVGSQLVIDSAGNFVGSVSGGCVEGEVVSRSAGCHRRRVAQDPVLRGRRRDRLEGGAGLRRPDPHLCRADVAAEPGCHVMHYGMLMELIKARNDQRSVAMVVNLANGAERLVDRAKAKGRSPGRRSRGGVSLRPVGNRQDRRCRIFHQRLQSAARACHRRRGAISPRRSFRSPAAAGYDVTVIDPRAAFASRSVSPA